MKNPNQYFSIGGTLPAGSPSYISRRADRELFEALVRGDYALVLDSRQKGKSSLMVKVAHQLHTLGYKIVKLDLQRFGSTLTLDQWYATLIHEVGEHLQCPEKALEVRKQTSPKSLPLRWISLIESLVEETDKGIVVFIDEIDYLRTLPFDTDEFLATIRSSFQQRSENPNLKKLVFCFAGASTPDGLVRNPALGNMIIGRRITVEDFQFDELLPFKNHLVVGSLQPERVLRKIFEWTKGHPYLTQLSCAEWESESQDLREIDESFRKQARTVASQHQSDHLVALGRALLNAPITGMSSSESRIAVLNALKLVLKKRKVSSSMFPRTLVDQLLIVGIVREIEGFLEPRNKIYEIAFDSKWIRDNMPDAEVRRQKRVGRRAWTLSLTLTLTTVVVFGSLAFQNFELAKSLRSALTVAKKSESKAKLEAYVGTMQSISLEIQDGNTMRAGSLLDTIKDSKFQSWEWNFAKRIVSNDKRVLLQNGIPFCWFTNSDGSIRAIAFTDRTEFLGADSKITKTIQHGKSNNNPAIIDGKFMLWNDTGTTIIDETGKVETFRYRIVARNARFDIYAEPLTKSVWSLDRKSGVKRFLCKADIRGATLYRDNPSVIVETFSKLHRFNLLTGKTTGVIEGLTSFSQCVLDEPKQRIYVASDSPEILVYDLNSGKQLPSLLGNDGPVRCLLLTSDGTTLIAGGADGLIRKYNTRTGKLDLVLSGHQSWVQSLSFGANEDEIISGGSDNTIRWWSGKPDATEQSLSFDTKEFARLKISNRTSKIVSYFTGEIGLITSFPKISESRVIDQPQYGAIIDRGIIGDSDGIFLTSSGHVLLDKAGTTRSIIPRTAGAVRVYSAEEQRFAFVHTSGSKIVKVDVNSRQSFPFDIDQSELPETGSLSGNRLAIGYKSGLLELRSAETLEIIARINIGSLVKSVEFSHDKLKLAACFGNGLCCVIDASDGRVLATLKGHNSRVYRVVFSKDDRKLASCSFDNTARIWDIDTGTELQRLLMKSWVSDVGFNPTGTRVVTSCGDGSVKLWEVETGREVFTIHKSKSPVFSARFSADGRWIIASLSNGQIKVWDGAPKS